MVAVHEKEHARRDTRKHGKIFVDAAVHHQHRGAGAWWHGQGSARPDRWQRGGGQQWEQQPHKSSWRRKHAAQEPVVAAKAPPLAAAVLGAQPGGRRATPGGPAGDLAAAVPPPEEIPGPPAGVMPPPPVGFFPGYPNMGDVVSRLEAELQQRLAEVELSDQDKVDINRAMDELQETVGKLGPKWCSTLFGSVANGFGVRASDLDVTCLDQGRQGSQAGDEGTAANILGARLVSLLEEHPNFIVINKVLQAKVPILRLRFGGHLDIDLSCENIKAVTNTRLLKAYASIDRRVRDVGIAVKLWAQANGVCGASKGHLSSYSFTLMAIYFLQVHPEIQLPHFDTARIEADNKKRPDALVAWARKQWRCDLTSVELLHRFFWFYSSWFSWCEEVVSVRQGERMFAYQHCFQQLRGRYTPRLHIEDPYERERNLHCVLGDLQELRLQQALGEAWTAMEMGLLPEGLRPLPAGAARRKKVDGKPKAAERGQAAAEGVAGQKGEDPPVSAAGPLSSCSTADQSGSELPERADHSQHSDLEGPGDAPGCSQRREVEPEPLQDLYARSTSAASARITERVAGLCKTGGGVPCAPAAVRSPVLSRPSERILARVTKACLESGG